MVIEAFTRTGCPHCDDAKAFLADLAARQPVEVRYHDVRSDAGARERLEALASAAGKRIGVPAVLVRERLFVGFGPGSGAEIEAWLGGNRARRIVRVPVLGQVDPTELGLPLFSLALGLVDGFNPCAMWVLLFLLSLLVNLKSRKRMAVIGGTFVAVSGLAYFAFMAAWLNAFMLVGISRGLQVGLGLVALAVGALNVKDFVSFGAGLSLHIPEAAKPGIYRRTRAILQAKSLHAALGLAVVLAVTVNIVELLCSAGLPAVFAEVLAAADIGPGARYGLMGIYILAYMLDDTIMVAIAVITLSRHKLQERGGRVLKLVSGLVMLALGLALVFEPEWLAWGA